MGPDHCVLENCYVLVSLRCIDTELVTNLVVANTEVVPTAGVKDRDGHV